MRKLPQQRTPAPPVLTGADLRAHRTRLGISQAELARQLHYSRSYVCDMERGYRHIPFALAKAFLDLLGALQAQREDAMTRSTSMLRRGV
ncbi:MAG: helix-turn-helix domain-containing protein [Ktedonobacterales bacterium]